MKTFILEIRAYMEFVRKIELTENKNKIFEFRVRCDLCENEFTVNCSYAGIKRKCPTCHQDQKWKITPSKIMRGEFSHEHLILGNSADVMEVECFGAKPTDFVFGNGWIVTASNGNKFEDPDFSGPWINNFNGHAAVVQNLTASFREK